MKSVLKYFSMIALGICIVSNHSLASQKGEIKKSFKNVKEVKIKTVSGDCIVKKGAGSEVEVVLTYTFDDDDFEPEFEQSGDRLTLVERFHGRNMHGKSTWRLTVPEKTDIDFSTASGDLEVSELQSSIEAGTASGDVILLNVNGAIEISTASGDIEGKQLEGTLQISTASGEVDVQNSSGKSKISTASGRIRVVKTMGEQKVSTASGNIKLSNGSGEFEVSAASGDISADEITITARSKFSTASGDVEVSLGEALKQDLRISTASGDAILNFNNHQISSFIEMTAKAGGNRIRAPFKFDNEEHYYQGNSEYIRKTVRKGSDSPRIKVSTASGDAVLLKN